MRDRRRHDLSFLRGLYGAFVPVALSGALAVACGSSSPLPAPPSPPKPLVVDAGTPEAAASPPTVKAAPKPVAATGEAVTKTDKERPGLTFYLPATLEHREGKFDLIVHFHGKADRAIASVETAGLHAVLVNVDLGVGSPIYRDTFASEASLRRVVDFAENKLYETGRLKNGSVARIALSAWSAGFGAVREIMKRSEDMVRVEAILLADGYFSDWSRSKKASVAVHKLEETFLFAHRATRGTRLFFLTHTAIDGGGYAGTGDCAAALIHEIGAELGPPHAPPNVDVGGPPAYAVDVGALHIWGFGGTKFDDHVSQHKALGAVQYAALKAFWDGDGEPPTGERPPGKKP